MTNVDMIAQLAERQPEEGLNVRRQAYSYVRFSTPEQRKGDSFRRQTQMAQTYAAQHGLELDEGLTFHDVGISGYRGHNYKAGRLAVFKEAVEAGQVPQGSVLLVEQLDRISRMEPLDALDVLRDILKAGVSVVTLNDGREYTKESLNKNWMDLLMALVVFVRANEESAAKSLRGNAFWSNKRTKAADRPLTAMTPEWVHLSKKTGKLELIADRAEVIRRVFDMTLRGIGIQKIAETFNLEGLETWGRGKRKSSAWHRSYILRIIQNPAVIGAFTMHRTEYQDGKAIRVPVTTISDYFPKVVDMTTFEEANAARIARGDQVRVPRARFPTQNILAGMAQCPKCGRGMVRVMKGSRTYPAFACSAAKNGRGCEYHSVRYQYVEDRLLQVLPSALRDRDGLHGGGEDIEARLKNAELAHIDLQERVELMVEDLQAERDPDVRAIIRDRLGSLAAARTAAVDELTSLRAQRDEVAGAVVQRRIDTARGVLLERDAGRVDRAAVNHALRTIFESAVINYPEGTVDLKWKAGGTLRVHYAMSAPAPYEPGSYLVEPGYES